MAGEIGTIADGFPGSSRGRGVAMFSKGNKRKEKDLRGKGKEEKREWKLGVMRARGERTERSQKKKELRGGRKERPGSRNCGWGKQRPK
jgi:hypothetical protein